MNEIEQSRLDPVFASVGVEVYTYDYIEELREDNLSTNIIAQVGSQELFLADSTDICIFGGKRGGSKTYSLLLEGLYSVDYPNFYATLLRQEKEDSRKTGGIIDKSNDIFKQFGEYRRSQQDMSWYFGEDGKDGALKFDYYSDSLADFRKRFQGLELSFIGVDEITHMDYEYFKYLLTSNRNAHGIHNRFRGTCNPDPDSWVAPFIDWWIDEEGLPIPERNGVVRYCFMYGDTVTEIYWGDSKAEVYTQAKHRIDALWKPEMDRFGDKEDLFIKSVTFIEGKLEENAKLLESDPTYLANLANQSEEQVARDLFGNWKFKTTGEELIKFQTMENFFDNAHQTQGGRYATCDPALEGGDKCVLMYWEGFHIKDIRVIGVDARTTVDYTKEFLELHRLREDQFIYDENGLGKIYSGYIKGQPFNNKAMPSNGNRSMFENLKSECAYAMVERLIRKGYSIEESLLDNRYTGKGYAKMKLKDILLKERRAIARDVRDIDKNWALIRKPEMKKIVGHSPDFIEALMLREFPELNAPNKKKTNIWML